MAPLTASVPFQKKAMILLSIRCNSQTGRLVAMAAQIVVKVITKLITTRRPAGCGCIEHGLTGREAMANLVNDRLQACLRQSFVG
jgi:hypothetical protein